MSSNDEAKRRRRNKIASASYSGGYGKPPVHSQFKLGNRAAAGRKRQTSEGHMFSNVMMEPVTVTIGNKRRSIPAYEAMIRSDLNRALAGDQRAATRVIKYWELFGFQPFPSANIKNSDPVAEIRKRIAAMSARMAEEEARNNGGEDE